MGLLYTRSFPTIIGAPNGFDTVSGAMTWDSGNGFGGTSGRWKVTMADTTADFGVCGSFTALGAATHFHMGIGYFNLGTLAGSTPGASFQLWSARSSSTFLGGVFMRMGSTQLDVRHQAVRDTEGDLTDDLDMSGGWPTGMELRLKKGAGDGFSELYFIGGPYSAQGELVSVLGNLDNDTKFALIDQVRHGATNISANVFTGIFYGDELRAHNDDTWIFVNPLAPPTLLLPDAQTFKYGSGRTITPITPTQGTGDIVEADLTCETPMTITVVPSGSAVVTGNTSAVVNVTGTQAEVLATIETIEVNKARPSLDTWFANHVVTVLVTDDEGLTVQGQVPIVWEPEAGVGTPNFRFTGTSAQVRAALTAIGWTPDTEGAAALFMFSKTSAPLIDEDEFAFTVEAGAALGSHHTILAGVGSGVLRGVL